MEEITEKTYRAPDGSIFRLETDGSITKIKSCEPILNESSSRYNGKVFQIDDGTISDYSIEIKEENADVNTLLIPNIYNIIDTHISTREKNKGQIVTTYFPNLPCQILSNSQVELMWDMLFNSGNLKEQIELERFKKSRYYSIYADEGGGAYTLVLNANKKNIAHVIVDLMINVFDHPKGKFLNASTEYYENVDMNVSTPSAKLFDISFTNRYHSDMIAYIDGKEIGKIPLSCQASSGNHQIMIKHLTNFKWKTVHFSVNIQKNTNIFVKFNLWWGSVKVFVDGIPID